MKSSGYDDKIQFRAGAEKSAAEVLNSIHVGGVNTSALAREGLKEMLRRIVTEEDKIHIYERYSRGELDEEVARLLLGDALDAMEEDKQDFQDAMSVDTSRMFQRE
jgi:hypothetical protein